MKKFFEYLKDKETVNIPDIQVDLGIGYAELIKAIKNLREGGYLGHQFDGVSLAVNYRYLSPYKYDQDDIYLCIQNFEAEEIEMLKDIGEFFSYDKDSFYRLSTTPTPLELEEGAVLDTMIELCIVHEFEGKYYPSIDYESYDQLRKIIDEEIDDDEGSVILLGYPLFMAALEDSPWVDELLELPFFSYECLEYVKNRLDIYKRTGRMPIYTPKSYENRSTLQFTLIENLLKACRFNTKTEYDREAQRCYDKIRESKICPDYLIDAAREATTELINYMSLSNIKEIQKIIDSED